MNFTHTKGETPMKTNKISRAVFVFTALLLASSILCPDVHAQRWKKQYRNKRPTPSSTAVVEYMAHLQGIGDQAWRTQPDMCGTTGQGRQLEGFAIRVSNASSDEDFGLRYMAYLQDQGETGWEYMPSFVGTKGEKRRLEAFWIEVVDKADQYSVYYRAHLAGTGWTDWYKDGEMCGTKQQQRAVEAIQIMMVDK